MQGLVVVGFIVDEILRVGFKNDKVTAGLSFAEILGRNSAPFPMPKSMFFSQSKVKNSQLTVGRVGHH